MVKQWYYQCAMCGTRKSRFIKNQEAKRLLSNLGLRTQLSEIPIFGDILCWEYKMNEIVKRFLLAGDKFMWEKHLKEWGFTESAFGPFTKNKERIQTFKETGNTKWIYRKVLGKACFQHGILKI